MVSLIIYFDFTGTSLTYIRGLNFMLIWNFEKILLRLLDRLLVKQYVSTRNSRKPCETVSFLENLYKV
jgi:hypothetical protein